MTDRTDKGRNLEDALHRLYQNWDERTSAPPFTFMNVREQLGEQERPSLLSLVSAQIGRLTAKWRIPVTKSQIGSITAVAAIVIVVALYIMLIGPGANDAEEIVPAAEPTASTPPTTTPVPEATMAPTSTPSPPTPTPEPELNLEALNDVGAIRPHLDSLLYDAEKLSRDDAAIAWSSYLSGSRIITNADDIAVMDLCSDGTGSFVYFLSFEHETL